MTWEDKRKELEELMAVAEKYNDSELTIFIMRRLSALLKEIQA